MSDTKQGAAASTTNSKIGVTNAALNKRVVELERRVDNGDIVIIRITDKPVERFLRCLFLGSSPDHPGYVVVFNQNIGVREYPREQLVG